MKRIYFDHAAATPVDHRVIKAMAPFYAKQFGNPGGLHKEGVEVRRAVDESRTSIANNLGVHADEIIFTGSATESSHLAIVGATEEWQKIFPSKKPHIIVSSIEHDAVLAPVEKLEKAGAIVTRVSVDAKGVISLSDLKNVITENTVMISIMYANNEIGTIQPISDVAKIVRKWKKESSQGSASHYPLIHTDACQAANYLDMFIPRLGVDLLTMNAAKIYGPKGVGLLYVKRKVRLAPQIVGGGHERGYRGGTENVPGIAGFSRSLQITRKIAQHESQRMSAIRDFTIDGLEQIAGVIINGSKKQRLPNNVHFSINCPDFDHEFLLFQLDARGIAVSTKSACHEKDTESSHVLLALNVSRGRGFPSTGIRVSLGRGTTMREAKYFLRQLKDILSRQTTGEYAN